MGTYSLYSSKTLGSVYEFDSTTSTVANDTWSSFSFTVTQVNSTIPPNAGTELVLYYLVSPTNLGSTISTTSLIESGKIITTLNGISGATTINVFNISGGFMPVVQNGLTTYQWQSPLSGGYLYCWISHAAGYSACTLSVSVTSTSTSSIQQDSYGNGGTTLMLSSSDTGTPVYIHINSIGVISVSTTP